MSWREFLVRAYLGMGLFCATYNGLMLVSWSRKVPALSWRYWLWGGLGVAANVVGWLPILAWAKLSRHGAARMRWLRRKQAEYDL